MKIVVNGNALVRSSLGVRRYFQNLAAKLEWPHGVRIQEPSRYAVAARMQETLMSPRTNEILWSPAHRGSLLAPRHVVTVHDCINAEYSYASDWRLPVLRLTTLRLLRNAARVVAISNATKAAILRNYDIDASRVTVIPSACRLPEFEDAAPECKADTADRENFVLLVTNALPHKNAAFALKALSSSSLIREQAVKLRIVGQAPQVALEAYRSAGLAVEVSARVSDEELHRYYREARFLMSPSLAEGHNLPIAEAICCGGNVVCSDIDVHREFYSGCAIFFDPLDLDSAVAAVDDALARTAPWSSPAALSSRSFADVAQDYRAVFESVGGRS